jgi:8-amino-7-oxononanoate synthase
MHTGGKALAVPGAYIVGSKHLRESLINRCRHLIYTTALPPEIGAWWRAAIAKVLDDAGTRTTLHENARRFRNEALRRGVVITGSEYVASIVVGADGAAVSAARYLQDCGFDVRAIRPPTVPSGTARLRVSIHADHDVREIDRLVDTLTRSLILSS